MKLLPKRIHTCRVLFYYLDNELTESGKGRKTCWATCPTSNRGMGSLEHFSFLSFPVFFFLRSIVSLSATMFCCITSTMLSYLLQDYAYYPRYIILHRAGDWPVAGIGV